MLGSCGQLGESEEIQIKGAAQDWLLTQRVTIAFTSAWPTWRRLAHSWEDGCHSGPDSSPRLDLSRALCQPRPHVQILVTVLHLSVVSYLLGHSPALFSLPTEWRYTQPQPGFVPKPRPAWPVACWMPPPGCSQVPTCHTSKYLSSSVPASPSGGPKSSQKALPTEEWGTPRGARGCGSPEKALTLLWQLEKASWVECLGELFSGVFENKEKFTSQKGHREHCN